MSVELCSLGLISVKYFFKVVQERYINYCSLQIGNFFFLYICFPFSLFTLLHTACLFSSSFLSFFFSYPNFSVLWSFEHCHVGDLFQIWSCISGTLCCLRSCMSHQRYTNKIKTTWNIWFSLNLKLLGRRCNMPKYIQLL